MRKPNNIPTTAVLLSKLPVLSALSWVLRLVVYADPVQNIGNFWKTIEAWLERRVLLAWHTP
jgi:hypothetical protein